MSLQSNECSKKDLNQNNETMNNTFVKIQQLRYHNFIDTRAVQRPVVSDPPDHIRPTRRSTDESEYMYWSDTVTVLRRTDYSVRVSGYTLTNPNNPTRPNIC